VKLGTLVTGVTYRNPAHVAKIVTTLDIISRGRAVLGVGAAWYEEEHEAFGFDFPPAGERLDRLEEALQICRAMFTEEAPSFHGKHYRIEKALNVPRPLQAGGPRIMVGGSGPKRTLRLAAQYADMCNINGSPDTIRKLLDVLRGHCADVGRDPDEITKTRLGSLFLSSSPEEAEQTSNFLRDAAGDEFGERFTVGDAPAVLDHVEALIDAGLDELIFNMPFADATTVRRAGELLVSRFG
jgi:alkanesulfonate monooxygenase SsuD/methylene tetrahydromethanopterin reductase-like flavin-dependent oxidoreductase (luciferase family)